MQKLFGDLVGVEIYFADFLVGRETKEQLNERLEAVFARCRETSLKLNLTKCDFFRADFGLAWTCYYGRRIASRPSEGGRDHQHARAKG